MTKWESNNTEKRTNIVPRDQNLFHFRIMYLCTRVAIILGPSGTFRGCNIVWKIKKNYEKKTQ